MKKITLLFILFCFCISAFSQEVLKEAELKRDAFSMTAVHNKKEVNRNLTKEDYFWYNDFSSPTDWIIGTHPESDGSVWIITTYATAPTGWFPVYGMTETFASTTVNNGFAVFNSDAQGAGGGDPQDSWIQYVNPIDFSTMEGTPRLIFDTYYARWEDSVFLEYSINDGGSWEKIRLLTEVEAHSSNRTPPDYVYSKTLTQLTGLENVLIRFRFIGDWDYGWFIDDVRFIDAPNYDIRITDSRVNFFEYYDYTVEGQEWLYHASSHFGQVPIAQYDSEHALCWFNVAVENNGLEETVTPTLNIKVYDPLDILIYDETIEGEPIIVSERDTIDMIDVAFAIENPKIGKYRIIYEVHIDGIEDENPEDNIDSAFFYVTEYTYGRDAKKVTGRLGPSNYIIGGYDGDMVATNYVFLYETQVKSIEVYIHADTDVGTAYLAKIMHIDPLSESWEDIASSMLISIEEEDLGKWKSIELLDVVDITIDDGSGGKTVRVALEIYYMGMDNFFIGIDEINNYSSFGTVMFFTQEGGWYRTRATGICLRLNTEDTYTVTFNVEDEEQNKLQGAIINVEGFGSLTTNALGVATINLADGDYNYSVSKEGYYPQADLNFTVEGEDKNIDITLVQLPAYTVTFTVKDESENAIENATIAITGQSNLTTDIDGIATIDLFDGNYTYSVLAYGYYSQTGLNFTVNGEEKNIDIVLVKIPTYTITFTVTDGTNPVQDATITITGEDPLTTDIDGIATIDLFDGNYTYSVEAEGYLSLFGQSFTVAGEDKNIPVVLEEGGSLITFIVKDQDEVEIQGATISITGQGDLTTNASGIATITLADGDYTYSATADSCHNLTDQTFTVAGEDKTIEVSLFDYSFVETTSLSNLNIYPNPTTGILNIENAEGASISIINIMGQTIYEIDNANVVNAIDISVYPQGTYFIRVIDGDFVNIQKINLIY